MSDDTEPPNASTLEVVFTAAAAAATTGNVSTSMFVRRQNGREGRYSLHTSVELHAMTIVDRRMTHGHNDATDRKTRALRD